MFYKNCQKIERFIKKFKKKAEKCELFHYLVFKFLTVIGFGQGILIVSISILLTVTGDVFCFS